MEEWEELARTPAERAFLARLMRAHPDLDVWPRGDEDGEPPWLCVSVDRVKDGWVTATLRLDFDGAQIQGGFSRYCLNGDDGVRALPAGVDIGPPDGIEAGGGPPEALADLAATWFARHIESGLVNTRRRTPPEPDPPPVLAAYRVDADAEREALAWVSRTLATSPLDRSAALALATTLHAADDTGAAERLGRAALLALGQPDPWHSKRFLYVARAAAPFLASGPIAPYADNMLWSELYRFRWEVSAAPLHPQAAAMVVDLILHLRARRLHGLSGMAVDVLR